MTAALRLPLSSRGCPAGFGCVVRLVVHLRFSDDDGKENLLLPVWRPAAANPRMGGGHRASEDGGKACGSKCKAIVPGHGQILPPKKKCAMRKIILATGYAMRRIPGMQTITVAGQPAQPREEGGFRVIWRNGGERRFRWQQVIRGFSTREEAEAEASEIRRMGYHAETRHAEDVRHGLPESFDSKTNASDYKLVNGWMVPA